MEIITLLSQIFEYTLFLYFGVATGYIFVFGIAGLFYNEPKYSLLGKVKKIAVLIPGYKEDAVILDVAKSALEQNYPFSAFDVVVIADSFKEQTLLDLGKLPLKLVEVNFEKSTKSKALNKAMEILGDDYDIAIVLDADNIMKPNFLSKIDTAFANGVLVVQGHRMAKNLNTPFAILDAISEEVNNHIFRKGHRKLGLSASLIGSAMAFDYCLFKAVMSSVTAVGGFDKELEFKLIKDGIELHYLNEAQVYDEKIQYSEDFKNQRRRWLSAQIVYLKQYFVAGIAAFLIRGNVNFLDKLYQMMTPPRLLLIGAVTIICMAYRVTELLIPDLDLSLSSSHWFLLCVVTYLAVICSIPKSFYNAKTVSAALSLPKAFVVMFLMLFKLKDANKKFIHTQHGTANNKAL